MSEIEELENEIIVDFNSNDSFSKIKNQVEKPKPKRQSSKKIIVEQVEAVETVEAIEEDIKPKPKRKSTKKDIIIEPVEAIEDIEDIKPKPKRKSTKKDIIIEDLKPVEEAPAPVEETPKKNIKTLEQVECPKCEKPMTKTTLRYHHDKSCSGEKINREDIPVKKRVVKDKIPEVIEPKLDKSALYRERLNQQMKIKKEAIKKLATNIA